MRSSGLPRDKAFTPGARGDALLDCSLSANATGRLDRRIDKALAASYHDGTGGWNSTAVKWWIRYHTARCEDPLVVQGPDAPLDAKLEDELRLMRFLVWLAEEKHPPVAVDTARSYVSTVQGWLARNFGVKLGAGMELHRIAQLVKGLHRLRGGKPPKKLRKALTPEKLGFAFDTVLSPHRPLHANVRAVLAAMLQGLMRAGEACRNPKRQRWAAGMEPTRGDVTFFPGGMQIMIAPEKSNDTLGAKTVPVTIGSGGVYVDAVREMHNLLRVDPTPSYGPCFRDPRTGAALTVADVNEWVQLLMGAIGEDPKEYGSHSARIGGATAMYKAGFNPLDIRLAGRWDSDCYLIYVHADRQRALETTRRMASTACALAEDPCLALGVDDVEFE